MTLSIELLALLSPSAGKAGVWHEWPIRTEPIALGIGRTLPTPQLSRTAWALYNYSDGVQSRKVRRIELPPATRDSA